jgi:hypothetical protein
MTVLQPEEFTPNLYLGKPTRTRRTLTCTLQVAYTGGGILMLQKVDVKGIWMVEVEIHSFLTSTLDGCEMLASRLGRFTQLRKSPMYPLNTESVWDPEPVYVMEKRNIFRRGCLPDYIS